MLMNVPTGSPSKQESEKSEDVVLARRRGLPEQLQEDRHRIASCLVDSPLVPDVPMEFRPSIISDVHVWRGQARIKSGTSVTGPKACSILGHGTESIAEKSF